MAKEKVQVQEQIKIDETPISEETAKQVQPNQVTTSEEFSDQKYLDMIAVNDELNMLNKGELRFKVIKVGEYVFDKLDKDGKPTYKTAPDGNYIYGKDNKPEKEQIISPYVDVTGEGFTGRISAKSLDKEEINKLDTNQRYIGTYYLTEVNNSLVPSFTKIVPYALELQARAKLLQMGK